MDQTGPTTTWIDPRELERSWHPAFYTPEYRELDCRLADTSRQLVPLGVLVELEKSARLGEQPASGGRWVMRLRRGGLEIEEVGDGHSPGPLVRLPHEAIVIATQFSEAVPLTHWDESLFPGGGLAPLGMVVLRPRGNESVGWLRSCHPILHSFR